MSSITNRRVNNLSLEIQLNHPPKWLKLLKYLYMFIQNHNKLFKKDLN